MDMMMDMAPGATDPDTGSSYPAGSDPGPTGASWTTKPATSTAGPGKRVRGKRHDEHDAHNRGYQRKNASTRHGNTFPWK